MKTEKIIETIKIAATEVEWNYPLDYTIALNEAAELLEKQILKKPIYNDYGYNGFDEFLPNCAKCPNCGREIPYGTWIMRTYTTVNMDRRLIGVRRINEKT